MKCEHLQKDREARKYPGFDGVRVREQCVKCGRGFGRGIWLKSFPLSVQRLLSRWEEVKKPGQRKKAYNKHLKSAHLRKLKKLAYARDGGLCPCGNEATDLAHLTYERFGHELLEDVVSSCSDCNQAEREQRIAG